MKSMLESFGLALCGFATSILVAIAEVAFARMTGFDFFTLSIWAVVPVGALLTGFAAASGYYFGSLYFHKRATATLLIQMVVIAGVTQLLIYWLGYATLVLDDGSKVADFKSFGQYMVLTLTKAHYRIGRSMSDTGEVGSLGYWIAGAQFLGFLFGGLLVYGYLMIKPVCATCDLYLRPLAKKKKVFADEDAAKDYYDGLLALAVDGPDFAALIRSEAQVDKVVQGVVEVDTSLLGCPVCKSQAVEDKVREYDGKKWKHLPTLDRRIDVPSGTDLAPVFRG